MASLLKVVCYCLYRLKHLHYVEMRFNCPQAFLSLDSSGRDDVSELKQAFLYPEELVELSGIHYM